MLLVRWLYRFFWGLMGGMVEITSFSWGRVGWSFGLLWRSFLILISLHQSFSCYSTSTINFISSATSLCFPFFFDQMLISSSDSYSQSTSYFSPYKSYTGFPILHWLQLHSFVFSCNSALVGLSSLDGLFWSFYSFCSNFPFYSFSSAIMIYSYWRNFYSTDLCFTISCISLGRVFWKNFLLGPFSLFLSCCNY